MTPELKGQVNGGAAATAKSAPGYPDLSADATATFNNDARPWNGDTHPGGTMQRVIGQGRSANGHFWQSKVPATEAEWRAGSAVQNNWDGNGGYVESPTPAFADGSAPRALRNPAMELAGCPVRASKSGSRRMWPTLARQCRLRGATNDTST